MPPTSTAAGAPIRPAVVVTVQDAQGNPVNSATQSITLAIGTNPASGTLAGTTTVATVSGVATFANLSLNKAGSGYTLTASGSGLTGATSAAFTVAPAPASNLAFTVQPTSTTAGAAINPAITVTVRDGLGNTVTSSTASLTVAITTGTGTTGATLRGTQTVNATNGVATFANLSLNKAGSGYTLTASGSGLTGATSAAFTVAPAPASNLAFTVQPTSTTAGAAINPAITVTVRDGLGNTVTSSTASLTVAITTGTGTTGATLRGTQTVNATNGVATFAGLSIDSVGTNYQLTATATGLTTATSASFSIAPAPAGAVFQVRACTGSIQAPQGEIFRVLLQDSTRIQEAAALLATRSTHIIFGSLLAGDGGFNAPWSWHLDPTSVTFPDVTAEIYQGCPSLVESNLSYWLGLGRFAPIGEVIARDR